MPEDQKPLRVIALHAENVKRLKAVSITPNQGDPLVTISGRNAQGKSSVLDAIEYALAGTRSIPERPIRDGNNRAEIVVETEEFTVTRVFTPSGSTLKITSKDGTAEFKRPQELLDRLTGSLTFDPLAFTRLKAADQKAELARISGIDLAAHDEKARGLESRRRDLGRDVKRLEAEVASFAVPDGVPDVPIDLGSITARYEDARRTLEANAAQRADLEKAEKTLADWADHVLKLEAKLVDARESKAKAERAVADRKARVESLVDPDTSRLTVELQEAQEANALVARKNERGRKILELSNVQQAHKAADEALEAHRKSLSEAVANAHLPVPGLALSESGVTLNGLPFDQASAAEQLRATTALACASNPRLRVALVRDGSLLDDDSLEILRKIAEESDLQVWVEMVGRPEDGIGIVIEDGQVFLPAVPPGATPLSDAELEDVR